MPTPDETIAANLAKPKTVEADGTRVEQHPLPDQVAAAEHLAAQTGANNKTHRGLRFNKIVPGGAE